MGISPKQFAEIQTRLNNARKKSPAHPATDPQSPSPPSAPRPTQFTLLGIDPSLRSTGWGVIHCNASSAKALAYGSIHCPQSWLRSRCLAHISASLRAIVQSHTPAACIVEGLFFAQNHRTTLIMGESRGAGLAPVAEAGIPIYEIAPRKVKLAIVGYGAAQKLAVAKMVQRSLNLPELPSPDAADALALALAYSRDFGRSSPILSKSSARPI